MLFPAIRRLGWNGLEKLEAGWNGSPTQIICWPKRQNFPCREQFCWRCNQRLLVILALGDSDEKSF